MDHFTLKHGALHAEEVPLAAIAEAVGTPTYVYSRATLERHAQVFREALHDLGDPLIAYAVKANTNAAVLATFARLGLGADVVSGGELLRALAAGVPPEKIVFSGVGKTREEMTLALDRDIGQFNVESEEELDLLSEAAVASGRTAQVAIRVNPDVEAGTHAKISTGSAANKFGIAYDRAAHAYARAAGLPGLEPRGVAVHIGSQLTDLAPLEAAFRRLGELIVRLRGDGHRIDVADLGGGLGVPYDPRLPPPPTPQAYGDMVRSVTRGWDVRFVFEPGRLLVANAGVLLSRVIRVKRGGAAPFVIVDAAMNDLLRPSLYDAWHEIRAVRPSGGTMTANVVGPVCESGDTFATGRAVDAVETGDLLVFLSAGAYAAAMSSSYNSRGLAAEVMVSGDRFAVVRPRQPLEALVAADRVPDWLA